MTSFVQTSVNCMGLQMKESLGSILLRFGLTVDTSRRWALESGLEKLR